jgi:undecaprenyl-diphosphatase
MTVLEAIILAIVEGITEFLPISSTGHMIIASSIMGIANSPVTKAFTIAVQFGAILSVVILYWKRFFKSIRFYITLLIAFIPALVFGLLFNDYIDALLENVIVVAITLLLGGIFLLFIDRWFMWAQRNPDQEITYPKALKIGLFQVIAMIPGVSRSAATIVGGLTQGLTRKNAAEFSFFLAVPTMFAATVHSLFIKTWHEVGKKGYEIILESSDNTTAFVIGNLVAFVVAMLAIRTFITYLGKYGFKIFGYYRIVIGLLILILYAAGIPLSIV